MAYKATSETGEFGLIERIKSIVQPTLESAPKLVIGIGDDCAVWRPSAKMLQLSSTDLLIEQVHFDLLTTPAKHLGSKAIRRQRLRHLRNERHPPLCPRLHCRTSLNTGGDD